MINNYLNNPVKQLECAMFNCKFLESKVIPLSEDNAQLKQSIHALIYYMEQRRSDFAQLLQLFDCFDLNEDRKLLIQLGDMVTIHEHLKNDIAKMNTYFKEHQQIIDALQNELFCEQQQSIKEQDNFKEKSHEFQLTIQQLDNQLKQEKENIAELNLQQISEINTFKEEIAKLQSQHQNNVNQIKSDYQKIIKEIKLNDDDYDKKLNQLKQEFQFQRDKMEGQHMNELKQLVHENNEKLFKLEAKNRQIMTELQNLKQDFNKNSLTNTNLQKMTQKQQKQIENLLKTINTLKEEIQNQKIQKQDQIILVQQFKEELEKATRSTSIFQNKYQKSKEQIESLELSTNEQFNLKDQTIQQQLQLIQNQEQNILSLKQKIINQQQEYYKQIQIQMIKYEKIINQNLVIKESDQQYILIDQETQFDSLEFKRIIEDYQMEIAQFHKSNKMQQEQIQRLESLLITRTQQLKSSYDENLQKIQIEFKSKLQSNQMNFQNQIEQLIALKEQEKKTMQYEFDDEKEMLQKKQEHLLEIEKEIITNLKSELQNHHRAVDLLNEQIMEIKNEQNNERQLNQKKIEDMNTANSQQKELIIQIFKQQENQLQQKILGLQEQIDEFTKNKTADFKQLSEQKKKIEQTTQQLKTLKEEIKSFEVTLSCKEEIIDQQQNQIAKYNEMNKYLQVELENTKQIYNIFRGTNSSQMKLPDDFPVKGELKRMLAIKLKEQQPQTSVSHINQKNKFRRPQIYTQAAFSTSLERSLPKVRSISNQKYDYPFESQKHCSQNAL